MSIPAIVSCVRVLFLPADKADLLAVRILHSAFPSCKCWAENGPSRIWSRIKRRHDDLTWSLLRVRCDFLQVEVITGEDFKKQGKVLRVMRKEQRVIVSGLNLVRPHLSRCKEYVLLISCVRMFVEGSSRTTLSC